MSKSVVNIEKAYKTKDIRIAPQFKKRDKKFKSKQDDEEEDDNSLQVLQNRIKRQPSLWREEFKAQLAIFKKLFIKFREDPSKEDEEVIKYVKFMTHISDVYKKDLSFVPTEFINILEQHYATMHPNVRFEFVQALRMIRTKKLATANDIIPLFFRLFRTEDKALRQYLYTCIVGDLKLLNKKAKANNVNKTLQNFVYNMIKDPKEIAAKKSLQVMIELYKRKIWNDENTVNVIAEAALQTSGKLCITACKFFLLMNYDDEEDDNSGDDSSDIEDVKSKILNTRIGAKMSRKKKHNLQKTLKNMRRRKGRKDKVYFTPDFLPIDLIRCPQEYSEKLFYRLRKSNEKLELKLYMMKFIGRLIGRHKLIMFNFYPFISKYINPHQKELSEFLAMVAESTHINVPHEEVSPIIEKICDNFINERASPLNMTIALNAVREIAARNPNAMNKEQLQYCIAYYKIKNKSVSTAIKGLINLFRDLRPELLEKKQLGKEDAIRLRKEPVDSMVKNTKLSTIEGLELLRKHEGLPEGTNMMALRLFTEKDFKLIKMLRLQEKAEQAKEQLKLDLKDYDIVDERYIEAENAELESADEECEADDENEESEVEGEGEEEEKAEKKKHKRVKFQEDDEEFIEIKDDGNDMIKIDDDSDNEELAQKETGAKKRSDGINFTPIVEEDVVLDFSASSGSDSDEYESANPHNFLDGASLNTFKKSKYQKLAETYVSREEKVKMKKEKARAKHDKTGKSKTNKEKIKNKPMSMMMPKKLRGIQGNYRSTGERLKELKYKLGKVRQGKLKVHRKGLKRVR